MLRRIIFTAGMGYLARRLMGRGRRGGGMGLQSMRRRSITGY